VATHHPQGDDERRSLSQVGRALERLGVEHILGYSPQARGRSERPFKTLQDRLVRELRLHGIATSARANRYLEETFLPITSRSSPGPWRIPRPPSSPPAARRSTRSSATKSRVRSPRTTPSLGKL
jgi:hypothetical protein